MVASFTSAYRQLGPAGIVGTLVLIAGIAVITWRDLVIGGGVALVLAGVGIIIYSMIRSMLSTFGMIS